MRRDAVVCRAHQHLRLHELRRFAAQNLADLHRQRLQPPQRAQGLGFGVQRRLQAGGEGGVERGDGGNLESHECQNQ